jgi:hypothetical protein
MQVALHHVAEDKTMPDRMSGRERDARLMALRGQAEGGK